MKDIEGVLKLCTEKYQLWFKDVETYNHFQGLRSCFNTSFYEADNKAREQRSLFRSCRQYYSVEWIIDIDVCETVHTNSERFRDAPLNLVVNKFFECFEDDKDSRWKWIISIFAK